MISKNTLLTGGGTDVGPATSTPPTLACVIADSASDSSVGPLNGSDSEPGKGSVSPSIVVCEYGLPKFRTAVATSTMEQLFRFWGVQGGPSRPRPLVPGAGVWVGFFFNRAKQRERGGKRRR